MAQVLTNDNMVEFIQTRQVPEFKAPEGDAAKAAAESKAATDAAKADSAAAVDQARDITTGKFVKADGEKTPKEEKAAPAAESDEDDDGAGLPDPIKKKIDRLIAKKHKAMKEAEEFGRDEARRALAAEARAEAAERQIAELRAKSGSGPATAKDIDSDEPKPEDFKTVGEYTRALTKYEVDKAAKKAGEASKKQSEQDKQQAQADERAGAFAKRQSEFMKATPDYEEVVEGADFEVPNVAMQYLVESEVGPQLAYHLAKNPDVADRLRNLSPGRVLAELGKLEIQFEKKPEAAKPAEAARTVSKAPPPITPLEGKTTPVVKDPAQMSFAELRALREQQKREGKWRV